MASWWWLVLPLLLIVLIVSACLAEKDNSIKFATIYCFCCGLIAGVVIGMILNEHGVK